jgi:N-formylglutamate amidohydrolase
VPKPALPASAVHNDLANSSDNGMESPLWKTEVGAGPLVALAIHDGHDVREEVGRLLRLDDSQRLREEDPFTGRWTSIAATRIVLQRSRFEVDVNRPRDKAVYLRPEDAWGLDVWKSPPAAALVDRSLTIYDQFYGHLHGLFDGLVARHGRIVVFDLHSYNHRRAGPDGPPADPQQNPEINLGTRTMDRGRWSRVVDRVLAELSQSECLDHRLDARENIKFFGGHLAAWAHRTYPETVCVLSVEMKKVFMNEWTGELDEPRFEALGRALQRAAAGALDELEKSSRAPIAP